MIIFPALTSVRAWGASVSFISCNKVKIKGAVRRLTPRGTITYERRSEAAPEPAPTSPHLTIAARWENLQMYAAFAVTSQNAGLRDGTTPDTGLPFNSEPSTSFQKKEKNNWNLSQK